MARVPSPGRGDPSPDITRELRRLSRRFRHHPYVEVAFTLEGCATITVGDEQREVKAGGIVVIPANVSHRFVNTGDTILRQIDVHASAKFIQTNL